MSQIRNKILFPSLFLLLLYSCSERGRVNPFDPEGTLETPLSLSIRPNNNSVELRWQLTREINLSGFNIYRKIGEAASFIKLSTLPANLRSFIDTTTVNFTKYQYYITGLGKGTESSKSNLVKIIPGPTTTYILSRFGYSVSHYAYDLQYNFREYPLSYSPVDWAFPPLATQVWLAYGQIGALAALNLLSGQRTILQSDSVETPIDIEYNELQDELLFLDDKTNEIGFFSQNHIHKHILLPSDKYIKLFLLNSSKLAVMGENHFSIYQTEGTLLKALEFQNGSDFAWLNNQFFIILFDDNTLKSELFVLSENGELQNTLEFPFGYKRIFASTQPGFFWVIEQTPEKSGQAVKLSFDGQRHLEISLEGEITYMAQNPLNKSLVFIENLKDMVVLTDSMGNVISRNDQIYDPIKARIQ